MSRLIERIFKYKDTIGSVAFILLITKVFGFLKFRLIASYFGASHELDIFWAAFLLPDLIFGIIIAGSVNAAMIPIFTDFKVNLGKEKFLNFFVVTTIVVAIFSAILTILGFVFADVIAQSFIEQNFWSNVFNVGSTFTLQDQELLADLTRIMLISPLLLSISAILTAFLQVHRRFFVTAAAPLAYNLGIIAGITLFSGVMSYSIYGLAWAIVIGSMLHFLIQIPVVYEFVTINLKIKHISDFRDNINLYLTGVWRILVLAAPRMLAAFVEQVNLIINTMISFTLTSGALSAYRYATSLYLFPIHIVAGAFAQVTLPKLAESYSKGDTEGFKNEYIVTLKRVIFITLPMVGILFVLRLPIVRLAYGVGNFDWWDTVITSWALSLLGIAIIGQTIVTLNLRALYALQDSKSPLISGVVTAVVNLVLTYYLTNFFSHYLDWRPILAQISAQMEVGLSNSASIFTTVETLFSDLGVWFTTRNSYDAAVGGLSLALSLALVVEVFITFFFLNRKIKGMFTRSLTVETGKMFLSSAVMVGFMYMVYRIFDFSLDTTRTVQVVILTVTTMTAGTCIYYLMCWLFDIEELSLVNRLIIKGLRRFNIYGE